MQIGRKIFYDVTTGNVLVDTGERQGSVKEKAIHEYIKDYKELSERSLASIGILELTFGEYAQDFAECDGYRVNPETKELEFSYPDASQPEQEQPFQTPLTNQINDLKAQLETAQEAIDFILMGGL